MSAGLVQANRGRALEDLVRAANARYRALKRAVIHKVPTAWVPIRGPNGKIVSAKVEEKASVDFLGHLFLPSGPLPLAFDAKEASRGDRWPLSKLEPHQYEYLRDCALTGAFSFVLVAFWELNKFFVLPFPELEKRWEAWKDRTGPASVRAGEPGLVEVKFWDYLSCVDFRYCNQGK
ncbi:Recombination protein U [Desulfofundulus kuznetsovii DSM 6115]|uniref:Holliday junction resolvase RecU n=1 Tax=Desulfofundulus kuznetsovii (strain DSM 6115 / VKM B-1805 / 17) TaxID=760568 RepID=A0AAU8P891_DESK7|nr:Recombination protein U [Desulfofundulus kuznetsovii DSM 6115]